MQLQLNQDETVLFEAGQTALLDAEHRRWTRYRYAQGTLYLTNQRLVFIGNNVRQEAVPIGITFSRIYLCLVSSRCFEVPLTEINEIRKPSDAPIWLFALEVLLTDNSSIRFSAFARKELIALFEKQKKGASFIQ